MFQSNCILSTSYACATFTQPCCILNIHNPGDQRSLYLKCQGVRSDVAQGRWKGIQLYNTTYRPNYEPGNSLNESTSSLKYVDILYAGMWELLS